MKEAYKAKPMYLYLMVLTIASTGGLQIWRTLFNNFAVETAFLQADQVGVIQAVREIPGFLALLVIFVLKIIKEHRLSALSILVMGVGIFFTGFFPSYTGLIITTLVMSFGFHYYETTNQSLTLQYFDKKTSPKVIGSLKGIAAGVSIVAGLAILGLSSFLSYQTMYIIGGVLVLALAVWAFMQDPTDKDMVKQRKKMVFRSKYWLFYALTLLAGARRQIFVAFAVFLLVKRFDYSIQEITALFVINNMINYFLSPRIGKAVAKYGERKMLSLEYSSLILIFVGYAFIENKIFVGALYILDHIFFNFAMALRTYFQKIGDPQDIAPTMAVGFTINHIAAVIVPVIGGLLWMIDYKIPFLMAAAISVLSLVLTQLIRTKADSG
jgi:predicted MFS family arabinose efflux permease